MANVIQFPTYPKAEPVSGNTLNNFFNIIVLKYVNLIKYKRYHYASQEA